MLNKKRVVLFFFGSILIICSFGPRCLFSHTSRLLVWRLDQPWMVEENGIMRQPGGGGGEGGV